MKIKTLSLTDFRAFPGPAPVTFELDGKNLLVYSHPNAPNIPKQEVMNAADAVEKFLDLVRKK